MKQNNSITGFHLLEILITLTIIGILSAIALPPYTAHVMRAHRLEAEMWLAKAAVALEHFHLEHDTYQGASLSDLQLPQDIAHNNYHLRIQFATNEHYQLAAIPYHKQANADTACGTLILNDKNEKQITGYGPISLCW